LTPFPGLHFSFNHNTAFRQSIVKRPASCSHEYPLVRLWATSTVMPHFHRSRSSNTDPEWSEEPHLFSQVTNHFIGIQIQNTC
jgi:hypothetical protein